MLVSYMAFDSPSYLALFEPRTIKVRNDYSFKVKEEAFNWACARGNGVPAHWTFEFVLKFLALRLHNNKTVRLHEQEQLPFRLDDAQKRLDEYAREVTDVGGEGVMIRNRSSIWRPIRSYEILKHKPLLDDEAVVTGYYAGKETDKGSKLLGLMGALEVDYQGSIFKFSGFSDEERQFLDSSWAEKNPGKRCPLGVVNPTFPIGSLVTFTYRELSDDGVPKEARYLRPRND